MQHSNSNGTALQYKKSTTLKKYNPAIQKQSSPERYNSPIQTSTTLQLKKIQHPSPEVLHSNKIKLQPPIPKRCSTPIQKIIILQSNLLVKKNSILIKGTVLQSKKIQHSNHERYNIQSKMIQHSKPEN